MMISEHERRALTVKGLERLAEMLRGNPELPLNEYSPVEVYYNVLSNEPREARTEYDMHARHMREVGGWDGHRFDSFTTQFTDGHKHHKSTLHMEGGRVVYTLLWIERLTPSTDTEEGAE